MPFWRYTVKITYIYVIYVIYILCTCLYNHIYPLYYPAGKSVGIERKITIVMICSITFLLASLSRVVSNYH